MRMTRVGVAALVLLVGAYLLGYWPQSRARASAEERSRVLEGRLAAAQARIRGGELLGQALTLKEVTQDRNYGLAQELSSKFFDAVRGEATTITDNGLRDALDDVLASRDRVTAALAKSDPAVADMLHDVELRLRRALNFVMPPGAAPTP